MLRITAEGRRRLHDPGGQPVPAGHAEDPARDLRDGPPQPVPHRGRPRRTATSTSPTTRRTPTRRTRCAGPAGHGQVDGRRRKPANYGWPYCATAELPYVDYDFATGTSGADVQLRAPGQRLAAQHRPARAAAGRRSRTSGTRTRRPPSSRSSAPAASARWAARRTSSTPRRPRARTPTAWPAYYDGVPLFYEWTRDYIKAFFTERRRRDADRERACASFDARQPDGHGVRPGRRRSTCSSTATASSARTCRAPSWRGSTTRREGNRTPTVDGRGRRRRRGPAAADGAVLQRGHDRPGGPPGSSTRGTSTPTARSTRAQPNPTHTYTEDGVYRATLKVTDQTGRTASDYVRDHRRPAAGGRAHRHDRCERPFQFGDTVHVRGHGHRRPAGRLQQGHGDLHPRPRHARAPADHGLRVHRAPSRRASRAATTRRPTT